MNLQRFISLSHLREGNKQILSEMCYRLFLVVPQDLLKLSVCWRQEYQPLQLVWISLFCYPHPRLRDQPL